MTRSRKALSRVPSRPKLADDVTKALRNAILSGRYADGEHLVLENLAEQLGVSIMPVRESLLSLSHEGLVQALPRRGFRARPLNDQDIDDLFELHAYLSGALSARAARSITEEELAALEAIHTEFEQLAAQPVTSRSAKRMNALNSDFHRTINRSAEGGRMRWFLRMTSLLVRQDIYEATPDWMTATLHDHPRIIAALKQRDGAAARGLIEQHFRQGSELSRPRRAAAATAGS